MSPQGPTPVVAVSLLGIAELPEELAFRERRLEKIRKAMAALEAEAQAAAEQAEAEGRKHPGVPDDKA